MNIIVCILGIDLISGDKTGVIKRACIVRSDLTVGSHIGVKTNLLDEALEVLVLSVLPILAVALCITKCGISTDKELLIKNVFAICNDVLGNGLLELAVNVAARLTGRGVVNDSKVLPGTGSQIYVCESVVRGSTVCISV